MQDLDIITSSTSENNLHDTLNKEAFGENFVWGVAIAAFQNEGAWNIDGKGESIWDKFSHRKNKIKDGTHAEVACDFYHRYQEDIILAKALNFNAFRFSFSWSRILPNGIGEVNQAGIDFYRNVINCCLENGLEPYVTIYHWDLPQILEAKGGWTNRDVIDWFSEYCEVLTREFSSTVKYWMVLNEPAGFTGLGYMTGYHAPGRMGLSNFLPAVHHATMCQAAGGRIIRKNIPDAIIGTTFSCSYIEPYTGKPSDIKAVRRIDALFNRLFIEPSLGLGYPVDELQFLRKMLKKYVLEGDLEKLAFDFDFIGLQNYFKIVVKNAWWMPYIGATEVKPAQRKVTNVTDMGWEIAPDGMHRILKQFSKYHGIKKIIITENGAAFDDKFQNGTINDQDRINFFKDYLYNILKAKQEMVKVEGYMVWTLTDNFEWTEGYKPRFGLIHVNHETQERTLKASAKWFKSFLGEV